jgi:hypothetical protein
VRDGVDGVEEVGVVGLDSNGLGNTASGRLPLELREELEEEATAFLRIGRRVFLLRNCCIMDN